jgi:hypothetical protein
MSDGTPRAVGPAWPAPGARTIPHGTALLARLLDDGGAGDLVPRAAGHPPRPAIWGASVGAMKAAPR